MKYTIISEQNFEDPNLPENIAPKVLIHIQLENGLVDTMIFDKIKYTDATKKQLIESELLARKIK